MANMAQAKNPLKLDDLYAAFGAADNIVLKKYIASLSDAPCIEMSDILKKIPVGDNVCLYKVDKLVFDKNENTQDKLTTVYSTVFSLENSGLAMVVDGHRDRVDLYIGVVVKKADVKYSADNKKELLLSVTDPHNNGEVLKKSFLGNFPGTELEMVRNVKNEFVKECKADVIEHFFTGVDYISTVSSIPAIRNAREAKSNEYVQGLEKLIDTMRGREYTAIILADAMSNEKVEAMCAEYEDLYSQLAPFKTSSRTVGAQSSEANTESLIKGVTDTTNRAVARSRSLGSSESKTKTNSVGVSAGADFKVGFGSVNASANYNHARSKTETKSKTNTDTESEGTAKSLTEQNSVAKSLTSTDSESVQISFENRSVRTLLERLDEQIKRMRSCEDFGMFDTCAYFAARDRDTVIAAASAFRSLTRGENSSVESSAVNVWDEAETVGYMKDYLKRFYHPEFLTYLDKDHHYATTASMLVSGREMAYQMALPKKSVAGVPVLECAEFGREVVTFSGDKRSLRLGSIYHMHSPELTPVRLNIDDLTAHTFITGSTGSGKSTTVYKLLEELRNTDAGDDEKVKFLVVEPAKGEYKDALATQKGWDVKVYGTNPRLTELLRVNPFRFPSDRIHIYEHLDRLTEIFNVCWPMYAAMPAVLKAAMENAYRSAGWDLVSSENPHGNDIFPDFADVAREVRSYINSSEYSDENKSNYKGSLLTRLESLTNGINSMIFSADDLSDRELFDRNVIVDLSRVGSMETKALIMGILVLKLQEYRAAEGRGGSSKLRHVTVLEEAHNLLKRTSTEQSSETANLLGKSVEMLANSIAEMRSRGEGFIIADQSPGLLDMSVIRNTNTKIIMRLPDHCDRELVGRAAGLNNDQIVELSKMPQGVAAVYQSDWLSPVLCKVDKPRLSDGNTYTRPQSDGHGRLTYQSLLLDLLDSKFRARLDDLSEENELGREGFRGAVLRSSAPTSEKIKLLGCLRPEGDGRSVDMRALASVVFDYFKNAREVLQESGSEPTVRDMRNWISGELIPDIGDCSDEQITELIHLLITEYRSIFRLDYPIWREFNKLNSEGRIL